MSKDYKVLTISEVQVELKELKDWTLRQEGLHREFKFKNFPQAFSFMTQAALAAEKLDHHPDWTNSYNRVIVNLVTHSAGAITSNDIKLAQIIDQIATEYV